MQPISANNFSLLPGDLTTSIFWELEPQDLIACSLVSKEFGTCAKPCWKKFLPKENCERNQDPDSIKRGVFSLVQRYLDLSYQIRKDNLIPLSFASLKKNPGSLSKSCSVKLPYTSQGKTFYFESYADKTCLMIRQNDSNEKIKIDLPCQICVTNRVFINGDVFIYSETCLPEYPWSNDYYFPIKMINLINACHTKNIKPKYLICEIHHIKGNIIDNDVNNIIKIKNGYIKALVPGGITVIDYSILPLVKLINILNKDENNNSLDMTEFMDIFFRLPCSFRNKIYGHLYEIQNPPNPYWQIGEHAFHNEKGQSSTTQEKLRALRRCLEGVKILNFLLKERQSKPFLTEEINHK